MADGASDVAPARRGSSRERSVALASAALAFAVAAGLFVPTAGGGGDAAAAGAPPKFAAIVGGVTADATEVLCLTGAFPPGERVTLLAERGEPCLARTGAAARPMSGADEPCTVLLDSAACRRGYFLAVVGEARHSFAFRPRRNVDPERAKALAALVRKSGLLADLARRQRPPPYDEVEGAPSEAFAFAAAPGQPVVLRYPVRGSGRNPFAPMSGALVVVVDGEVFIPYAGCPRDPMAFRLDGVEYLFGASRCCDCGWLTEHVHAVERGRLRLAFETSAGSM